jgi:8-oxo-dGTP diphosphatase
MHKVFGIKESVKYTDREGAYLIPVHNNKIGVIKTDKGYFLLGGGLDKNETDEECIKRECLEETGYTVVIKEKICSAETFTTHPKLGYFHPIQSYYIGELDEKISEAVETDHILMWIKYEDIKGKMFAKMQNWALEQAWNEVSVWNL